MSGAAAWDVSIAMATFNGERFLRAQLDSLASQTVKPRELVVGDDGSADATAEILRQFAASAPFPVRVLRRDARLGSSGNFLATARCCEGEWVAFCDQDDVWLPDKLERVAAVIRQHPSLVLAAHRAAIIDAEGRPVGKLNEPPISRFRLYGPLDHRLWRTPFGFTEVFRRCLVLDFPAEDRPPSTTHDCWVFWLANVSGATAFLPERLALYRRHGSNASQFTHPPGLAEQLAGDSGHDSYARAAERAGEFAAYLERHGPDLGAELRARAAVAAGTYRQLGMRLRQRADLWNRGNRWPARFGQWSRLVAGGGYQKNCAGGMGWQSALKDLARLLSTRVL